VGVAASLAAKQGIQPRQVASQEIQAILRAHGMEP
jgi:hypothetical protein